jgi:hypothetical protein
MKKLACCFAVLSFCLSARSQWTTSGNNIYNSNTGYVGIGTTSPRTNLEVAGYVSATTGLSIAGNVFNSNVPVNGFTLNFSNSNGVFSVGSGAGFGYSFTTNGIQRLGISDTKVTMLNSNVLINTQTDNGNKLQVNGNLWATGLVLPTGAAAGKVLTSDANGNATWQTASLVSSGTSLFLANGNSTGATQTPLSLGNCNGTATSVPSFTFNTSDNGTSNLDLHSTRWGSLVSFTRMDPTGSSYNVMSVGGNNTTGGTLSLYNTSNQVGLLLNGQGTTYFTGGAVAIGTTNPGSNKLAVEGVIACRKVVVTQTNPFPDYVFAPGYHRPSLDSLSSYIQAYRHLPDMPTADSVQKNGLDLANTQTALVKKIEELTLYLIDQKKELDSLKEQNRRIEELNQRLEQRNRELEMLEQRIERLEHPDKSACKQ